MQTSIQEASARRAGRRMPELVEEEGPVEVGSIRPSSPWFRSVVELEERERDRFGKGLAIALVVAAVGLVVAFAGAFAMGTP